MKARITTPDGNTHEVEITSGPTHTPGKQGKPRKTVYIDGVLWKITRMDYPEYTETAWKQENNDQKLHYNHTVRRIMADVTDPSGKHYRLTVHPYNEETPLDLVPVAITHFDSRFPNAYNAWVEYAGRPFNPVSCRGLIDELTPIKGARQKAGEENGAKGGRPSNPMMPKAIASVHECVKTQRINNPTRRPNISLACKITIRENNLSCGVDNLRKQYRSWRRAQRQGKN